ncbi:MAG: multicopper oxidase domain-containing protein [Thermomicrobiales bacterium]|nr:multicopper oxidase domain-containing protein [Thermomicrobiales bacterium]
MDATRGVDAGRGWTMAGAGAVPGTDRRVLLRAAAGLGLTLPFLLPGMAAAQDEHGDDGGGHGEAATGEHTEAPAANAPVQPFQRYDPRLAPVEAGSKAFSLVARDVVQYVAEDVACAAWCFDDTIPGRAFRVVEGDTVDITFRVDAGANAHHSLDFHSAKTPPDKSFRTIMPGEELEWSFVAKHPGAFMYHCGTPQILMHIGAGMYGAMIVDPREGWPEAQELVFVQSDFYLKDGENGVKVPDYERMLGAGAMDYVVFNGHANQYVENPIEVKAGEPVRIFVVNAGPNVWSSFHVVGTVFDRVCVNANPKNALFGLQSVTIGPGDSAAVEFTLDEPGLYPAVNHAFGHAAHGAVALLQAE